MIKGSIAFTEEQLNAIRRADEEKSAILKRRFNHTMQCILDELRANHRQNIRMPSSVWRKAGIQVAGMQHESADNQLAHLALMSGIACYYDGRNDCYIFSARIPIPKDAPDFLRRKNNISLRWHHEPGEPKCSCEYPSIYIGFPSECRTCMRLLP
jgi:hypothetical protein